MLHVGHTMFAETTSQAWIWNVSYHATSNPAKTTFNITPLLKKRPFFLGGGDGVIFWEYFHELLGLAHKKNFEKTLGQSRCFGTIIGQFRPFCDFGNFKKSGIFSIFGQIWRLFFFQNTILDQIGPRIIKNDFSDIL